MLHIRKVLAAKPKEHVASQMRPLLTPWGEALDVCHVLEEHPTPQFMRNSYRSLNGVWQCMFMEQEYRLDDYLPEAVCDARQPDVEEFDQDIVVPFSPESQLSRVGRQLRPGELLWYRRTFDSALPSQGQRILLHFQAVDYVCAVRVNGYLVDYHVGGYTAFCFDISDYLYEGENELCVCVADPSEAGQQPRGKQRIDRGDIWYSAQSGIWQSVWLELVPETYIASARIEPKLQGSRKGVSNHVAACKADLAMNIDTTDSANSSGELTIAFQIEGSKSDASSNVAVDVFDGEDLAAHGECTSKPRCSVVLQVEKVHLWSPEDPHLYSLRFSLGSDVVESYCAFRSIAVQKDEAGRARLFLNGRPYFVRGVLDQGYWSDGLLSAPADEAFVFDIVSAREAGFNTLRKHVKLEAERWYYHCDRLGMLVWQDMVSGGAPELNDWQYSYKPTLFRASWNRFSDTKQSHRASLGANSEVYRQEWKETCQQTIAALYNHPSVVVWNLFNEGWGQFDSAAACKQVKMLDKTRPISAASGWYDQGVGDIRGIHNYFRDFRVWQSGLQGRAFFFSECGGFAHRVEGHSSLDEVYGYEIYSTVEEWRGRVQALLKELDSLEQDGLAGFILTQLSDIEEENNGILTFDRRINKLNSQI